MPAQSTHYCLQSEPLEHFLSETLSPSEEHRLVEHLEVCAYCRSELEQRTAQESLWTDIRQACRSNPIERDRAIDEIQRLIGPSDDPQMLGRLGIYEVSGIVGRGSTGIVVKARDTRLNRFVAIKILAPHHSMRGRSRRRFEREGRAIAAIRDDHIIPVFGVGEYHETPYLVMQYMPSGSLQHRLERKGPMTTCEVARIGQQMARGLAAAHRQGVIHRDIKPANVLLEEGSERALVTDFGMARVMDESTVTFTDSISGTPEYMSPEQARGDTIDQRSDLFGLGSVLYAACTGRSPFAGSTVYATLKHVCESEPRPVREENEDIAPWLVALIAKLHAKDPSDRFKTAEDVANILEKELAHLQAPNLMPVPNRDWWVKRPSPRRLTVILVGLLLVCSVLAVWELREPGAGPLASAGWLNVATSNEITSDESQTEDKDEIPFDSVLTMFDDRPIEGTWEATRVGPSLQLKIMLEQRNDRIAIVINGLNVSSFQPEPSPERTEFYLRTDFGTFTFKGGFGSATGHGTFRFDGSEDFRLRLTSAGIADVPDSLLFRLSMESDEEAALINLQELARLDLPSKARRTLMVEGIDANFVRSYQDSGISVQDHLAFVLLRVNPELLKEYIVAQVDLARYRELIASHVGYALVVAYHQHGLAPDKYISFLQMGVPPNLIEAYRRSGYDIEEHRHFLGAHVRPSLLQDYEAVGLSLVRHRVFLEMHVEASFLIRYIQAGYEPHQHVLFIEHRIEPAFLREYEVAGFDLTQWQSMIVKRVDPKGLANRTSKKRRSIL